MLHIKNALWLLCAGATALAQASTEPIIVEAASGDLGTDWLVETSGGVEYITIADNGPTFLRPGLPERVATYELTFPAAGNYHLFIRVRVGADTFDADSLFVGNGFGEKDPEANEDWINVNGFAAAVGYDQPDQWVVEGGALTSQVWKWVLVNRFDGGNGLELTVPDGALTQTFQIGGREDGFEIATLAFGPAELFYTVNHLENGLPGSTQGPNLFQPPGPEIALGNPKFLGSVYSHNQTQNVNFTKYWNAMWPGNAGKWGWVEGTRGEMNFTVLDEAYNLAKENGYIFNFHILVWGNQQPLWMSDLPVTEQREAIENWFHVIAERYPEIDYLQVVNEPLHDPPQRRNQDDLDSGDYIEALGGTGETGWDWVIESFRLAREIFPQGMPLMINEYGILNSMNNARRYKEIIDLLMEEDLIDAIGVQGHAFTLNNASANIVQSTLDLLAETGLPIMVTEMDIDGLDDELQLTRYQRVFPVIWEHPAVIGVNLAGARIGMWRTDQGAYLINSDESERPALQWLREYVESTTPAPVEGWRGYPLVQESWADTGSWLDWLYTEHDPWLYSLVLHGWIYQPESLDSSSGAWLWVPRID